MCRQCNTNPIYEFTNQRKLCKSCFIRYFQKKFLYTIRKFRMISQGDIIGYKDSKDFRGAVLKEMLEMFSKRANINIAKLPSKKISKIAVLSTLDSESDEIISVLITGNLKNIKKISPIDDNIIKPLYLFSDKEVMLYAKLKNMKFKAEKKKYDKFRDFIDLLEKKHPEIKRAIVNSYLKIFEK